jgi:hypothetical protein
LSGAWGPDSGDVRGHSRPTAWLGSRPPPARAPQAGRWRASRGRRSDVAGRRGSPAAWRTAGAGRSRRPGRGCRGIRSVHTGPDHRPAFGIADHTEAARRSELPHRANGGVWYRLSCHVRSLLFCGPARSSPAGVASYRVSSPRLDVRHALARPRDSRNEPPPLRPMRKLIEARASRMRCPRRAGRCSRTTACWPRALAGDRPSCQGHCRPTRGRWRRLSRDAGPGPSSCAGCSGLTCSFVPAVPGRAGSWAR